MDQNTDTGDKTEDTNQDPLHGICNHDQTQENKYYRLEDSVFAEPLEGLPTDGQHQQADEFNIIGNVIVQKSAGKVNKKYHFHIEDRSQPVCPQQNCKKNFTSMALLTSHIRLVHCADQNRCICEKCGAQFPMKYLLRRHLATHEGMKTECPVCRKMLSPRTDLTVHLRSHANERHHQCSECSKRFVRKATLNTHVKFVHRNGDLQCDQCFIKFKSRSEWSRHVTSHRTKQ